MNNKGFTMVELLATIALIAVIMLIFMPTIGNLISDFQENDKVDMLQKSAIMAAKEYVTDGNYSGLSGTNLSIAISDLQKNKYLDYDEYYDGDIIKVTYDVTAKKFTNYEYKEGDIIEKTDIRTEKETLEGNPCEEDSGSVTFEKVEDYTFYFICSNGKRIYKYIEK